MPSCILILIANLITISFGYTSEEFETNYFKREYLSFNRSTNQLARRGVPVQLAPSLETDLKHYKSEKLKTFLATQKRPIRNNVLNDFINQTVLDWCVENLKNLREEPQDELNYMAIRELNLVKFEYSCTPIFLISAHKTYKQTSIEQIILRKMDDSFIVSIPRTKHPEYQLAYCEEKRLTTYSDIEIPSTAGLIRLSVQNTFPRLSTCTQCSIPLERDIIFLGDWVITDENIFPRYTYEDTPLPEPSLAAYVPKPLRERLLKSLFENYKRSMTPAVEIRKTVRLLWDEIYPSVLMPKTLAAIQAADRENKLLRKFFSHPTLSHDIGFKGTPRKLDKLTWEYVYSRCTDIEQLNAALMIRDISDITSWKDIFDIGTSLGFPEEPTGVIKSLLRDDRVPS